jgi:hypothetical protein
MAGLRLDAACSVRFFLLAAGCTLTLAAVAGDWRQSISVPFTYEADSNPTLAAQSSTVLRRTRIVPDFKLNGSFGADEIWTNLSLMVERSSDKNISLPRQDPNLQFGWRKLTQKGEYGLVAKYQEASTRLTELEESGLIVKDGTRKTQTLAGNWRAAISERSSLAATADHSTVAYDSGALPGSSNTSLSLNYTYGWNERIEPFVRLTASHYLQNNATTASNNTTLIGGAQFKVSDNFDWTVQGGTSRISGATSTNHWQGSLALNHTSQRNTTSFEIGRSVGATGASGFVESDRLKANWSYAVGARTQVGLDASRVDTKSLLPNTMNQFGLWASQELSLYWNARLSYQYKQLQQAGQATASSALLGLSLVFAHPDF